MFKSIYRFALPIICTNLLQAVYNLVDMLIVGRVLGSAGITSVNVGGQIVMVVFSIINACAIAEAVLVGKLMGAKNEKEISRVVNTMLLFSLLIATGLIILSGRWKNREYGFRNDSSGDSLPFPAHTVLSERPAQV